MRADKIIEALDGPTKAGKALATLARRPVPLAKATISHWKKEGIPPLWQQFIRRNYRELGLKTYHLMDCSES